MTVVLIIALSCCPASFVLGGMHATAARRRFVRSLIADDRTDYSEAEMQLGGRDHDFHTPGDIL